METADVVLSLAGRDKGGYFFVLSVEGAYALLADGKKRKLETPKRKKLKHIQFAARTGSGAAAKIRSGEKVLNSELRRELAEFCQKSQSQNQGG